MESLGHRFTRHKQIRVLLVCEGSEWYKVRLDICLIQIARILTISRSHAMRVGIKIVALHTKNVSVSE